MKTHDTNEIRTAHDIFDKWEQERRLIERQLDALRDWMLQVSELGLPRFGETGDRLAAFRKILVNHFDREDGLCEQLSSFYEQPCAEVNGMCRQSSRDHANLLSRTDQLIENLNALEPNFVSFQAAIEDVELLMDAIEQHDDYESESIGALMPSLPPNH